MQNSHPDRSIPHDLPEFDATMRKLVRVPKADVKAKPPKEKRRKAG
jgi:hypothetical protein